MVVTEPSQTPSPHQIWPLLANIRSTSEGFGNLVQHWADNKYPADHRHSSSVKNQILQLPSS